MDATNFTTKLQGGLKFDFYTVDWSCEADVLSDDSFIKQPHKTSFMLPLIPRRLELSQGKRRLWNQERLALLTLSGSIVLFPWDQLGLA